MFRDGFEVIPEQKRIWDVEIDLLDKFLEFCKLYHFKVFAMSGTLLGAVRHKGFIPWDDDLDLAMTRAEFEKMQAVAPRYFTEPYFFQTAMTDREFFFGYARLRNSNTTGIITGNESSGYHSGIFIDIYVLDGYIGENRKLKRQLRMRDAIQKILVLYHNREKERMGRNRLFKQTVMRLARLKSYEYWVQKYCAVLSMYNDKAGRVGLMTHIYKFLVIYNIDISDIDILVDWPFEGRTIPIPQNYDKILKDLYGDYWKYPPVSERGEWHNGVIIFNPDIPYKEYYSKMRIYNEKV